MRSSKYRPAVAGGTIVARPREGRGNDGAKRPPLAAPLPRAFDLCCRARFQLDRTHNLPGLCNSLGAILIRRSGGRRPP
jgi:hypothetical protein